MKKILLICCLLIPFIAVKAQTFQRKAQQPAFFMPKSALTNQQPERLPAVEDMNYKGRHPSNYNANTEQKVQASPVFENKHEPINHLLPEQELIKQPAPVSKPVETKEEKIIKAEMPVAQQVKNQQEEKPQIKKEKPTSNSDSDYQKTFSAILKRHNADLIKISQGDYTENPEITSLVESYKPETHTIKSSFFPRAIIVQ